ncbi:MAG TPA: outer membrane beta-barrel protein [Xanthobacteraceae bacterium]|nr:outer membrane beta-barrel protein [Xanthobacteraceae bacterium]
MKRFLLAAVFGAIAALPAVAADMRMPVKAPPPAVPVVVATWTGCYIGAFGGYGWGKTRGQFTSTGDLFVDHDLSGAVAGGQAGCDLQTNRFVFGVEVRGGWSGIDSDRTISLTGLATAAYESELRHFVMLTGRVGFLLTNDLLLFVRGGGAWAKTRLDQFDLTLAGTPLRANTEDSHVYPVVGGGAEYRFNSNWSIFADYSALLRKSSSDPFVCTGLGAACAAGATIPINTRNHFHIAMAGINFRWGAAPVVARY